MAEKLFPDSVLKNQNWAYLWINSLKFYTVCFYCMPSRGLSKYIEIELQTTCCYLIWSFFLKKQKEVWNYQRNYSLSCFLYDLWWKVFLLLYSINWPNFFVWLFLLLEILGNMCIAIVYLVVYFLVV